MVNRELSPETEIGKYWDGIGGDRWVSNIARLDKMLAPTSKILLTEVSKNPSNNLLELGCGAGDLAASISAKTANLSIDALDISYKILVLAKKRIKNNTKINLIHGDAQSYNFKNRFYDLVYSKFGVMFFNDPAAAFTNINRSIKEKGKLVFLSWNILEQNPWMDRPSQAAFTVLPQPEKQKENSPGAFSLAKKEVIRTILTSSGFKNICSRKHEINVNLGSLTQAVDFATQLGPAATPFSEAKKSEKKEAKAAIRDELKKFKNGSNIVLPGSCWLTIAS